jgi:tetratricopeptide (TPR) repeat protein
LLRAPRQRLHRRAAQALSNASPSANSAIIAHHLEQAGAIAEAAACWETAGQEARQRWAHAETAAHFRHALSLAEQHDFGHDVRIRLVTGLAYSMHLNGERSEADGLMEQNSVLIPKMHNRDLIGWFYCVWAEISSFLGKRHIARIHCEKALEAGRQSGDGQLVATALVGLSTEDFFTERFRPIIERNEEAISLLAQEPSLVWQASAALSRCLFSLGYAAVSLGEIGRARKTVERFYEFDRKLLRAVSEHPMAMRAVIGIAQGDWDEVVDTVNTEMDKRPSPFADAALHYFLSCAVLGQGDIERAVPMLEEGLRKAERYRSEQVQLWAAVALGTGYCDAGRLDDAATVVSNCKQRAALIQVPDTDAVLLEGRVALERANLDKAYRLISAAKADYVTREMEPKQAHSLCYLATVAGRQGNQSEALEHLRDAYRIYSEMDAKWYVEKTRSLAEQLGISAELATA